MLDDSAPEPCGCEWHSRKCGEGDREFWLEECPTHRHMRDLLAQYKDAERRRNAQSDPSRYPNPYDPATWRK